VLLDRPAAATFIVIDVEALTPAGRPAEPTEVAAIALGVQDGQLAELARFEELIRPPAEVPVTAIDQRITGITARRAGHWPIALDRVQRWTDFPGYPQRSLTRRRGYRRRRSR